MKQKMKNQDANENIKSSLLSLDEILCAADGKVIGGGRENFFFSSVVTDSRNVFERETKALRYLILN